MNDFASTLNKQNQDEMKAMALAGAGRIEALERRLAKVEAKLADASGLWDAAAASPVALPSPPAADTDPAT